MKEQWVVEMWFVLRQTKSRVHFSVFIPCSYLWKSCLFCPESFLQTLLVTFPYAFSLINSILSSLIPILHMLYKKCQSTHEYIFSTLYTCNCIPTMHPRRGRGWGPGLSFYSCTSSFSHVLCLLYVSLSGQFAICNYWITAFAKISFSKIIVKSFEVF